MVYYASIQRKNKIRIGGKGTAHFVWVTWLHLKMNGLSHCHIRGKSENQWPSSHLIDATTMRLWKCLSKLLRNHPHVATKQLPTPAGVLSSFLLGYSMLPVPSISLGKSGAVLSGHSPTILQWCVCSIMAHLVTLSSSFFFLKIFWLS